MKKIFLAVVLLSLSLVASAQDEEGWTVARAGYLPLTVEVYGEEFEADGYGFEVARGLKLLEDMPVYLEAGLGLEFLSWSDGDLSEYGEEISLDVTEFCIPISLGYKLDLQEGISVMPFAGLKARWNLSVLAKYKYIDDDYIGGSTDDVLDEDEFGEDTVNRFIPCWQIGASVMVKNLNFTIGYGSALTDLIKNEDADSKFNATTISIGYMF